MTFATNFGLQPLADYKNVDQGKDRIGIVDIGSNTIRMVVYDAPARLPVPIFNERAICALGKGIGRTGHLNPVGKNLAFQALDRLRKKSTKKTPHYYQISMKLIY